VEDFRAIAEDAEATHAASSSAVDEGRSSVHSAGQQQLIKSLQDKYSGRWPLLYNSVELYGPDSQASTNEVHFGLGTLVLLDPEESCKSIGQYSLHFYGVDEGASSAVRSFPIGPKMSLSTKPLDSQDADGPAAMLQLATGRGLPVYTLAFDDAATAASFSRDFRVRSRLMDVSLKTASGKKAVDEARSELRDFQRRSIGARLRQLMFLLFIVILVAAFGRFAQLYAQAPDKAVDVHFAQVQKDLLSAARIGRIFFTTAGTQVCRVATGAVPAADLQACVSGGGPQVTECITKLLPREI